MDKTFIKATIEQWQQMSEWERRLRLKEAVMSFPERMDMDSVLAVRKRSINVLLEGAVRNPLVDELLMEQRHEEISGDIVGFTNALFEAENGLYINASETAVLYGFYRYEEDSENFFCTTSWPTKLAEKYHSAKSCIERAKIVCYAIDYFADYDNEIEET